MSTRTVVSQAELDAALADPATRRIVIDSPEGVWLSLVTDRTDVISEVGGSARVGKVDGLARVDWVGGSARIDWVIGSAHVDKVGGSARIDWVGDSAHVGRVGGSARIDWVGDSAHVDWVIGSAHVGRVAGFARVDRVDGSAHVGWVGDSARVGTVGGSAHVGWVGGSAHVEHAAGTPTIHMHGGTLAHAAPHVAVYLHHSSAQVEGGHVIDLTELDLTDLDQWRAHTGADHAVRADNPELVIDHVSSEDHPGRLDRYGLIRIGCWEGTPAELRAMVQGDVWPSDADEEIRAQYRPRILAFADLCDQQIRVWAEAGGSDA